MSHYNAIIATSMITLGIQTRNNKLTAIHFLPVKTKIQNATDAFTLGITRQLYEYFENPKFKFNIPIQLNGTDFQNQVWQAMQQIPIGQTKTYADVAAELKSSPRAIGNACRKNPVPIIIPCHRIVAKNSLGGFNGKIDGDMLALKNSLLIHEGCKLVA